MPSPHIIPQLLLSRFLILTFTISLSLFLTARTSSAATNPKAVSNSTLTARSLGIGFGDVQVGDATTQFETLTNTGSSTITISQAKVTGGPFGTRGLILPVTLAKGQSITFRVIFTARAGGNIRGKIAVASNASNPKLDIALLAKGVSSGRLTSNTSALNFGNVPVGTSKVLKINLAAAGSSVTISSATSTSSEFHLTGLTLPKTIPAGQSASVSVIFTPQSSGVASGNISIGSNANAPIVETLMGSGAASSGHAVKLRWNPSTSSVAGYNVYRSSKSGGPYSKINPTPSVSTSFVDTSVQGGMTYYYVSAAITPDGKLSKYSNQLQAVVPSP
jgi:hypothetical protein